ncbi:MAG TPA: TetR/AcrR family transcriptional regulator C-terminal domain-containing protein [Candidatus Dormibacteraeota bacterium]|nr:TetR/AcrR family transcriptional regulator C-terminal domain-containing protein [Candidatus Dormibacteraeota bacterium]
MAEPGTSVEPRGPGRPARLSWEAVVTAAEAIVARDGIEALTMRRVARELRSSPMAIYRHVRDKDELLVLLLDRLVEQLPRPPLPEDPRARLVVLWRLLHDGLDRDPWVVEVLVKGHLMARSVLWVMEEILVAFVAAGLSHREAAAAYRTTWQFTVGALTIRHGLARTEASGRPRFQRALLATVDPAELPTLAAVAPHWATPYADYETGLSAVLDGLLRRG